MFIQTEELRVQKCTFWPVENGYMLAHILDKYIFAFFLVTFRKKKYIPSEA